MNQFLDFNSSSSIYKYAQKNKKNKITLFTSGCFLGRMVECEMK